jgi:hypothetical protein
MADNDFPGARQKLYYSVWSASRARSLGPPFAGNAELPRQLKMRWAFEFGALSEERSEAKR